MNEFRTKITESGEIIIPAACCHQLHLKPGDELIIRIEDDEMHLFSLKHALRKAQSLVHKHNKGKSLVQELKKIRKEGFS